MNVRLHSTHRMRLSAASSAAKLFVISVAMQLLIMGCTASSQFRRPESDASLGTEVLHRYLDRWVGWKSLTANVKITVSTTDTTVSAKGHIIYLLGERFELGFVKPYNRFLGNFYVTPQQLVYWDIGATPHVFTADDSVSLPELLPISVPDWDPRDLLPFPISGRTGGFQPDSIWNDTRRLLISGASDGVAHRLEVSQSDGLIKSEWVARAESDPMLKKYSKHHLFQGWPIATRVICTDESGEFAVSWVISNIELDAEPYHLPLDSVSSRTMDSLP